MPRPLEVQYIEVGENPILLRTLDLKPICIISERTLIDKLWDIVVYKVEIFLALFLVLMTSFSIIEKEFSTNQNFL